MSLKIDNIEGEPRARSPIVELLKPTRVSVPVATINLYNNNNNIVSVASYEWVLFDTTRYFGDFGVFDKICIIFCVVRVAHTS